MRKRTGTALAGVVALVGAALSALAVGAAPAGATTVNDETSFRTAWANDASVVLDADITLTNCGTGAATRNQATAITVDGAGHTLTQTCAGADALDQSGTGGVSLANLTVAGGKFGVSSAGTVILTGSTVTGQSDASAAAGVVTLNADLFLTSSTVTSVHSANGAAYGVASSGGNVTMTASTVSDVGADGDGAGVFVTSGSVTATRSAISSISGGDNAIGVLAFGTMTGTLLRVSGIHGTSTTYGIGALGVVTLTESSLTDVNAADDTAFGAFSEESSVALARSTVASISGSTGAVGVFGADASLVNSTVTAVAGVAVYTDHGSIAYSDIVHNGSSALSIGSLGSATAEIGGVSLRSSALAPADAPPGQIIATDLQIFGSVLSAPQAGYTNCAAPMTVTSKGYNFADDPSCALTATGDTQTPGADPLLGPLADNGGNTPTLLPQTGSPLLDKIPAAACQTPPATGVTTDQRTEPRPGFEQCDIGAVELQPLPPPPVIQPTFTG